MNRISSTAQHTRFEVVRLVPASEANPVAKGTQPCEYSPKSPSLFKTTFMIAPQEPLASVINYTFLGMLLFSSLTAISRKEGCWVFFFLLLHSMEGFLLTWSIIKNQSNKVTFSNLNTGYKKLNCQSSLPNGTVTSTLSHKDFQESD